MATAAVMTLVSPASPVNLLLEDDKMMKVYALSLLNENVDLFWPELTESVEMIVNLHEDPTFPERDLAALLLAKIEYHNGRYGESMLYALQAGDHFTFDKPGQFEYTIISKCIESYIVLSRNKHAKSSTSTEPVSPALHLLDANQDNGPLRSAFASNSFLSKDVKNFESDYSGVDKVSILDLSGESHDRLLAGIHQIFNACFKLGGSYYNYVIGVAIEAHDLKVVKDAILHASAADKEASTTKAEDLVEYILDICSNVVQERALRTELLELVLDHLTVIPNLDYFSVAKCVVHLGNYQLAAQLLKDLIESGEPNSVAIAYQVSFDLYDNGTQKFLLKVIETLEQSVPKPESVQASESTGESSSQLSDKKESSEAALLKTRFGNVRQILNGEKSTELHLEFLYRSNHYDTAILDRIRSSLDTRVSIYHSALALSNGFMNAGTTNDSFYRNDRDWLERALSWSQFTAIAALGVIHRGHISQAKNLLSTYLPGQASNSSSSPFCQGGSLYALGLIYSNNGAKILNELQKHFVDAARDSPVQHGGALGLGLAGMATASEEVTEHLKTALDMDSATAGDAVGIAMGLVNVGTGDTDVLAYMLVHACETEHEKLIRGIALGMALIMYGRNEAANDMIEKLLESSDSNLRYGGVMMIAMAYCGSGSNSAVRELLSLAVTDVNDDVRRLAVLSLGFVLFRKPETVPRLVELLADSYNAHVRYGAAMALGIACAGTGLDEAVDLLEPMLKDSVDFVRQGALISLAMILVQQNETVNPKVAAIRKTLMKIVAGRHEDSMTKFGCALALGIIDAGGRNCTISLQTQTGNLNMSAIVGMAVFTQYWYWFPLANFLSLAFTPTAIIAVDNDLQVPSFKYHCSGKQSLFDYPPAIKTKTEEAPEKVRTAILSTTARAQRRQARKRQANPEASSSMDVDTASDQKEKEKKEKERKEKEQKEKAEKEKAEADRMDVDEGQDQGTSKSGAGAVAEGDDKAKDDKPDRPKEKAGFDLENMSRVLPSQVRYMSFTQAQYVPVKKATGGVIVVTDTKPDEDKKLVELNVLKQTTAPAPRIDRSLHYGTPHGGGPAAIASAAAALANLTSSAQPLPEEPRSTTSAEAAVAPVPGDFDYVTDGEEDGDGEEGEGEHEGEGESDADSDAMRD